MEFNAEKLKEKALSLKKRHYIVFIVVLFLLVFSKVFFSTKDDNLDMVLNLRPRTSFSLDEIMEEEKAKVNKMISNEKSRNKGVGRDIFFSNSSIEEIAPKLTGIMIGRKRSATFSSGEIFVVGDEFYGTKIIKISERGVVLEDELGAQKILEIRRK